MRKIQRRIRNSLSSNEITDAALRIINEKGIESLSMREIAKELKCSVASPYAYFSSREDIIKELIQKGDHILTEDLLIAQKKSVDPLEQLRLLALTYWNFATANRELHKLMYNTLSTNNHRKVFFYLPNCYRVFLKVLKNGMLNQKGNFSKQKFHAVAMTMWAWIYGLLVLEMTGLLNRRNNLQHPIEEGILLFEQLLQSDISIKLKQ